MIRDIVKDTKILTQKSKRFEKSKHQKIITDLLDTAKFHKEDCVGLAAIQINEPINLFVVLNLKTEKFQVYCNPFIIKQSNETYETEESCLSLEGSRKVIRHNWIDIMYSDINGKITREHVSGLKAEIIQHEYDHLFGRLI